MARIRDAAAVIALVLLALTPVGAAGIEVGPPQAYNSGNASELVAALPVGRTGQPNPRTAIYCVDLLTPPLAGEVLLATADLEVTNDLPYRLLFTTQLLLVDACDAATGGTEISEANGSNVDNVLHHATAARSGVLTDEADTTRRYVVLVAWATAWSPLWQPDDVVTVESDYGRLSVLRWPAP